MRTAVGKRFVEESRPDPGSAPADGAVSPRLPLASATRDGGVGAILTPREKEIVSGVYDGLSNKEIARFLAISPWTVSSHLRQIFAKLGITRRVELCRLWGALGEKPSGFGTRCEKSRI